MKIAIISDLHGNLSALETVFNDINSKDIQQIICLGDLVEGGEFDQEVVNLIREKNIPCVQGNHDQFNLSELKKETQEWLQNLPKEIVFDNLYFTHISPRDQKIPIKNNIEVRNNIDAWNIFDEYQYKICFIGHLHYPVLYGAKCKSYGESTTYEFDEGIFDLDKEDRFIVCFGAIAYPRGGGKYIRYGLYDNDNNSLEFVKLEGYLLPYGLCKN